MPKANTSPYPHFLLRYVSITLFPELALSVGVGCRSCTVESFDVNVIHESGMEKVILILLFIALPLYMCAKHFMQ